MEGEAGKGNCLAWAARDPSGILSPYQFDRRAVGSDDVALKIKYCGVCFADVVWTRNLHHDTMYPVVPGHEIAGVVTQVGSNVTQFKVGDNVGVGTYVNTCRNCEHCNEFLEVHCKKGVYTFNGIDYDGTVTKDGYSNHIVVRDRYCFKIPDGYPLELAAPLLCAGITVYTPMMYHKMNQPGKSLGVVGLGGLGHMAVKFGKAFGLNVTVFSTSESKRDEAINILGVDKFVVSSDPQQMQILRRYARARSRSWTRTGNFSELERVAQEAWALGHKAWDEAVNYSNNGESGSVADPDPEKMEPCPTSVGSNKGGEPGKDGGIVVLLPCGLAVGSSISIIGTPHNAHEDFVPQLAKIRDGNGTVMVSQFIVEFQGLKAVDGEEPSKILHLNPRIKGDWSEKPILEHNTCYRMSWGKAMRCDGLPSRDTDETD